MEISIENFLEKSTIFLEKNKTSDEKPLALYAIEKVNFRLLLMSHASTMVRAPRFCGETAGKEEGAEKNGGEMLWATTSPATPMRHSAYWWKKPHFASAKVIRLILFDKLGFSTVVRKETDKIRIKASWVWYIIS